MIRANSLLDFILSLHLDSFLCLELVVLLSLELECSVGLLFLNANKSFDDPIMLALLVEWIDVAVVFFELVPIKVTFQRCIAVGMLEPAFAIHLPISEMSLVYVTQVPGVDSFTIN